MHDIGWPSLCGNSTLDTGEECDNGTANSDTLPDACRTDCSRAHCGDGVKDTGEACDLGLQNGASGSACSSTCMTAVPHPDAGMAMGSMGGTRRRGGAPRSGNAAPAAANGARRRGRRRRCWSSAALAVAAVGRVGGRRLAGAAALQARARRSRRAARAGRLEQQDFALVRDARLFGVGQRERQLGVVHQVVDPDADAAAAGAAQHDRLALAARR